MADITWHSLGIDQGFLRIMANVNFHGSFSTAHPLGDAGGDMVSLFEGDIHDISLSKTWYYFYTHSYAAIRIYTMSYRIKLLIHDKDRYCADAR